MTRDAWKTKQMAKNARRLRLSRAWATWGEFGTDNLYDKMCASERERKRLQKKAIVQLQLAIIQDRQGKEKKQAEIETRDGMYRKKYMAFGNTARHVFLDFLCLIPERRDIIFKKFPNKSYALTGHIK